MGISIWSMALITDLERRPLDSCPKVLIWGRTTESRKLTNDLFTLREVTSLCSSCSLGTMR